MYVRIILAALQLFYSDHLKYQTFLVDQSSYVIWAPLKPKNSRSNEFSANTNVREWAIWTM